MPLPDDLSLPTPPPPRPARREASIDAAMRRFDGVPDAAVVRPPRRWAGLGRPQVAALASVTLVALVSVPLWIEHAPPGAEPTAVPSAAISPATDVAAAGPGPVLRAPDAPAAPVAPRFETSPTTESASPPSPVVSDKALAAQPAQNSATDRQAVVVQEQVVAAPPPPPSPAAPAALSNSAPAQSGMIDDSNIVVTGSRAGGSADGEEQVRRESLDEVRRRSADRAISALDRKIEQAPSNADAYLRRGEQWRRKGDLARALADLDRAVRLAPRSARAYYERSLVLRRLGQTDRAEADEQRAIELDRRYDAIIP